MLGNPMSPLHPAHPLNPGNPASPLWIAAHQPRAVAVQASAPSSSVASDVSPTVAIVGVGLLVLAALLAGWIAINCRPG